jgi:hypothetical protein
MKISKPHLYSIWAYRQYITSDTAENEDITELRSIRTRIRVLNNKILEVIIILQLSRNVNSNILLRRSLQNVMWYPAFGFLQLSLSEVFSNYIFCEYEKHEFLRHILKKCSWNEQCPSSVTPGRAVQNVTCRLRA